MASGDTVYYSFTGGELLDEALQGLDRKLQRTVKRKALRAGAKPLLAAAKDKVPVDEGVLKQSLGITVRTYAGDIEVQVLARKGKQRKADGWYAHMVEFGSRNHDAQPFLRPAAEEQAQAAIAEVAKVLEQELIEALKK